MNPGQRQYRSFLLRLWSNGAHRAWHVSLQSTATLETIQFASIEAMLVYLEDLISTHKAETLESNITMLDGHETASLEDTFTVTPADSDEADPAS